jgi:hypothetical protein
LAKYGKPFAGNCTYSSVTQDYLYGVGYSGYGGGMAGLVDVPDIEISLTGAMSEAGESYLSFDLCLAAIGSSTGISPDWLCDIKGSLINAFYCGVSTSNTVITTYFTVQVSTRVPTILSFDSFPVFIHQADMTYTGRAFGLRAKASSSYGIRVLMSGTYLLCSTLTLPYP